MEQCFSLTYCSLRVAPDPMDSASLLHRCPTWTAHYQITVKHIERFPIHCITILLIYVQQAWSVLVEFIKSSQSTANHFIFFSLMKTSQNLLSNISPYTVSLDLSSCSQMRPSCHLQMTSANPLNSLYIPKRYSTI